MDGLSHEPVLLRQAIEALNIQPDGVYVDATFGRGGHSRAILDLLGQQGRLLAIDRDPEAVETGKTRFGNDCRFRIHQGAFSMLERICAEAGVIGKVNGILMDLGVSSPQLDDASRGFSFSAAGPLDMRMDPGTGKSAADWLAHADEREISDVLFRYGEERHAKRIARAIVAERAKAPITVTTQLVDIIVRAMPGFDRHKHPATRTFQAIRIFINRELEELRLALTAAVRVLAPRGRLVVISFHSLEDRLVKRFMRDAEQPDRSNRKMPWPAPAAATATLQRIGKPAHAAAEECQANPRARSAVLRVAERLA